MSEKTYYNIEGQTYDAESLKVPSSGRLFRGAWKVNGDVIEVNMTKARDIHRDRLRQERDNELKKLDAKWFVAAEKGNTSLQSEIAAKKQKLRDAPSHSKIASAKKPETLAAITLEDLTK